MRVVLALCLLALATGSGEVAPVRVVGDVVVQALGGLAFGLGTSWLVIRLMGTLDDFAVEVSMSIALAMFCAIILAVTLSILFSYVLHRITCCDPADGAVPLLSTVSDVMSILILMAIAERILPKTADQ